ncbi:MAG: hypothetical protein LBP33_07205 [Candidatus Adiutrix sp.]|jgi:hypothetical protein|nr:hypothetical protein [Candidatus Adiutrix sp.]
MSDEPRNKDKTFDFPMMPIYGLDLGRELGSLDSRLGRVENDIQKLDAKIDNVDGRVNKCLVAIHRLDERSRNTNFMLGGTLVAVLAGIVLQLFFK